MKNYTLRWADGSKSAFRITKKHVIQVINNWRRKNDWGFIVVRNEKTGREEMFSEGELHNDVSEIEV